MRLRTFFVQNYRSITEATLNDIEKFTAIIGPNNTGKSNLLRAFIVALSVALEGDYRNVRRRNQFSYVYEGESYSWKRDIPQSMISDEKAATIFKLTFEFTDEEKASFRNEFGINLSKSLQMKFELFKVKTEYNIIMPGRAKAPMEAKINEIGLFIREKLDYQYIPCVRSSELTTDYFSKLVNRELSTLSNNPEYIECIEKLREMRKPIYNGLGSRLTEIMKTFLPKINAVEIDNEPFDYDIQPKYYSRMRRLTSLYIDDGNKTTLEEKGDGVKSLIAIALMQSLSLENVGDKSLLLCIEEPEAHLHPDAIHSLRSVISEISSRTGVQVIISTHSPILADRNNINNNVIINDNYRVTNCKNIDQIRDVLGVRLTDNMAGTQKVVLVEGESDRRYFTKLCSNKYPDLKEKIEKCELEFVNVHSASKMDYQIRLYNSMITPTIVLLDNDDSGRQTYSQLLTKKIKSVNEILIIKSRGMEKSELEDIIDIHSYSKHIHDEFGICLDNIEFKERKKPWSDRLKKAVTKSPILFDQDMENKIKTRIADIVDERGFDVIGEHDIDLVNNIVDLIRKFATS